MNKQYFSMAMLLAFFSATVNAVGTMVTVTNNSSYDLAKVMIKTTLAGVEKGGSDIVTYKGSVVIDNLQKDQTKSVDLRETANRAAKPDGTPSKWRMKNINLPTRAVDYLDFSDVVGYAIRAVQPQKEDKQTWASRWKRQKDDNANYRTFIIVNNESKEYKTKKNGNKVQRLLKVLAQQ